MRTPNVFYRFQELASESGHGTFRPPTLEAPTEGYKLTLQTHSTMNKVIFDYLITQGYPAAAARFAKEAGIPERQAEDDLDSIEERRDIKLAILKGEIESAIHKIIEYDPQVRYSAL